MLLVAVGSAGGVSGWTRGTRRTKEVYIPTLHEPGGSLDGAWFTLKQTIVRPTYYSIINLNQCLHLDYTSFIIIENSELMSTGEFFNEDAELYALRMVIPIVRVNVGLEIRYPSQKLHSSPHWMATGFGTENVLC